MKILQKWGWLLAVAAVVLMGADEAPSVAPAVSREEFAGHETRIRQIEAEIVLLKLQVDRLRAADAKRPATETPKSPATEAR